VMIACLEDPRVDQVLAVTRRPCGHAHPKLRELVVKDFREVTPEQLAGYDACFYGAGISSIGMDEAAYTVVTYDTPLRFCEALAPNTVLCHVSGRSTDSTEQGKVMWARVKGKAENALSRLPLRRVVHFRPAVMNPVPGQRHIPKAAVVLRALYPLLRVVFPGSCLTLQEVQRAMMKVAIDGAPKNVLEVDDIRALTR